MDDSFFPPTRLPIVRSNHQGTLTWLQIKPFHTLCTLLKSHTREGWAWSLDATEDRKDVSVTPSQGEKLWFDFSKNPHVESAVTPEQHMLEQRAENKQKRNKQREKWPKIVTWIMCRINSWNSWWIIQFNPIWLIIDIAPNHNKSYDSFHTEQV